VPVLGMCCNFGRVKEAAETDSESNPQEPEWTPGHTPAQKKALSTHSMRLRLLALAYQLVGGLSIICFDHEHRTRNQSTPAAPLPTAGINEHLRIVSTVPYIHAPNTIETSRTHRGCCFQECVGSRSAAHLQVWPH
jgi:hypothetical protein